MNKNEETKVLDHVENEPTVENRLNDDEVKNATKSEFGKRAATVGSAFVGGAAGAAAAEYAQTILQEQEEGVATEEEKPVEQPTEAHSRPTTPVQEETTVESEEVEAVVEDTDEMPTNATLVSAEVPVEDNQDVNDSEVRVVGVQTFQNEDGSQAIVAGLDLDGDHALVVDVNSDGTMNLFIHDDNGDGQISDNEIHDITADNISTQAIIEDAAVQAGQDDLYMANNDMPDYVNDADTGLMDI